MDLNERERGIAAAKAGKRVLARLHLRRATELDPDDPIAWLWLGWVADSPSGAILALREALQRSPNHSLAECGLQWALAMQGYDDRNQYQLGTEIAEASDCHTDRESGEESTEVCSAGESTASESESGNAQPSEEQPVSEDSLESDEMAASSPTVLIVDDSRAIRGLVALTLEPFGYRVLAAADEEHAWRIVTEESPGLVLLDAHIPDMNSFQFCKRIKKDESTHFVPVVMLTVPDSKLEAFRSIVASGDAYLTKPLDASALVEKVATYLPAPVAVPTHA